MSRLLRKKRDKFTIRRGFTQYFHRKSHPAETIAPQGTTPQKQTAGGPFNLQHSLQQWVLEVLFCIHLRNKKSSATHQVRGGGASKASDGGEKNQTRQFR